MLSNSKGAHFSWKFIRLSGINNFHNGHKRKINTHIYDIRHILFNLLIILNLNLKFKIKDGSAGGYFTQLWLAFV